MCLFLSAPLTCRMSRKRKYVLATSWNCSNKLTGRKVMMLYLDVMMQLFWRVRGKQSCYDSPVLSSATLSGGAGEKTHRVLKLLIVLPVVGSDPSLLLCKKRAKGAQHLKALFGKDLLIPEEQHYQDGQSDGGSSPCCVCVLHFRTH